MSSKTDALVSEVPDLATAEEAKAFLEITDGELGELIEDGSLRRVKHADGARILGCDIARIKRENDPSYLARVVAGEVVEGEDDADSPRGLVARVPRF